MRLRPCPMVAGLGSIIGNLPNMDQDFAAQSNFLKITTTCVPSCFEPVSASCPKDTAIQEDDTPSKSVPWPASSTSPPGFNQQTYKGSCVPEIRTLLLQQVYWKNLAMNFF